MPEHIGEAKIKIVPDLSGFTEAINRALHAIVLHRFVLWLMSHGHISGEPELTDLVDQFIADTEGPTGAN
jgi:hypothetical protein